MPRARCWWSPARSSTLSTWDPMSAGQGHPGHRRGFDGEGNQTLALGIVRVGFGQSRRGSPDASRAILLMDRTSFMTVDKGPVP